MSARFPIWIGRDITAAYSNAAVGTDDRKLPMSEAWVKVADGPVWQGTYDHHPLAPRDVDSFKALAKIYTDQGIAVKPWMVVNGVNLDGTSAASAEADIAIVCAQASGGAIIVDLEPQEGENYWRLSHGANAARAQEFLDACHSVGVKVWVAPDARPGRLEPCDFATWAAHPAVEICLPQVYFSTFQVPYGDAIDTALAALGPYGIDHTRVGPVLPGDATGADLAAALDYCYNRGTLPVSIFQRANMTADEVTALTGGHSPWRDAFPETDTDGPTPATSPTAHPPIPGAANLNAAKAALEAAAAAIQQAQAALGG